MIALLAAVSSQALWVLCDNQARTLLAYEAWTDDQSSDLASEIATRFQALLTRANIAPEQLTGLMGVSGPGAFTGLRSSGAFLMGLSTSLHIPLKAISTFDIYGQSAFIPLQHQRTKTLSLAECLATGLGFLKLEAPGQASLATPGEQDKILGISGSERWPTPEDLLRGARASLSKTGNFHIFYGLEPKISGVRTEKA